jgi:hypothetical protein
VTAPQPDPAIDASGLDAVQEWLTVPDVAERLGIRITRVHQLIREGALLGARRDGVLLVPAELVPTDRTGQQENFGKHLLGVLNLLRDAKFTPEEALTWLYTPDDTLPGTPAANLATRPTEVKRRAQALGY